MRYVFSVDSPRAAHTHTNTHEAQTKPATNEAASKKKKTHGTASSRDFTGTMGISV